MRRFYAWLVFVCRCSLPKLGRFVYPVGHGLFGFKVAKTNVQRKHRRTF